MWGPHRPFPFPPPSPPPTTASSAPLSSRQRPSNKAFWDFRTAGPCAAGNASPLFLTLPPSPPCLCLSRRRPIGSPLQLPVLPVRRRSGSRVPAGFLLPAQLRGNKKRRVLLCGAFPVIAVGWSILGVRIWIEAAMWKDSGVSTDDVYAVRPECVDVPKTRFKIKVCKR